MGELLVEYQRSVIASLGFFWKAGWAFVLGYFISAMIQTFVPKGGLTRPMGNAGARSIGLSTLFGAISSSCSFAVLATARSLIGKGAHFIAGVAFMFASTNLVIELGILIVIFLGWPFLIAEIIGGLILIAISSVLIRLTWPQSWIDTARERAEEAAADEESHFDWRSRIRSREGWLMVGQSFVMEWKMVWQEILIGFTIAGLVATQVPQDFWAAIFLTDAAASTPGWLVAIENALVAPFVAAATFIGSMGNIPLATVLNANGVMFAGIMGFIYSDLMVPPLVAVNAKYYGWRVALYIAGIMFVSIVATALILHFAFATLNWVPESRKVVDEVTRFKLDYTFWLNVVALLGAGTLTWAYRIRKQAHAGHGHHEHHDHGSGGWSIKSIVTLIAILFLAGGLVAKAVLAIQAG